MRILRSEIYFPIIVGIHLVFWAIDLAGYQGDIVPRQVVGEVFSSWVVTVFAFNFLMATRARWVERIFGGLDKMYLIHRRSAAIAVVLLLLHFLSVPKTPEFQIGKPMGMYAMVLILLGVIVSAAPVFKRKFKYNKWLNVHKTMGLFYTVGVAHALFVPTMISELPIIRIYVFGMAAVGIVAWIYRTFLYNVFNSKLDYVVHEVRRLPGDLIEATLRPQGPALQFAAGQFAFFRFADMQSRETHPFTISSHPAADDLRVTIKALGDYTGDMQTRLQTGSAVQVEGPFGHFTRQFARATDQLWFAGGIGITPFLALAAEVDPSHKITLYWCVNSAEQAVYRDELEELARNNPGFAFELWCTDTKGYISLDKAVPDQDLSSHAVLICGPDPLKKSLIRELKSRGVPRRSIHDEEFSFR